MSVRKTQDGYQPKPIPVQQQSESKPPNVPPSIKIPKK